MQEPLVVGKGCLAVSDQEGRNWLEGLGLFPGPSSSGLPAPGIQIEAPCRSHG